jgi:hypothetical protein
LEKKSCAALQWRVDWADENKEGRDMGKERTMANEFLPRTDAGLDEWAGHFDAAIAAAPEQFGLSAQQSADYSACRSRFHVGLLVATDPATRGGSTVLAKSLARRELEALSRQLAGIIRANPAVTDQQRYDLGLRVRAKPSRSPVPAEAPRISLLSMVGHRMRLKLRDATSTRQGKPADASGASVFSFIGPTPPAKLSDWTFEKNTGRTGVELDFDPALAPGTRVWVTAFWFNPRQEPGPTAWPVDGLIQFGMNGLETAEPMRQAA